MFDVNPRTTLCQPMSTKMMCGYARYVIIASLLSSSTWQIEGAPSPSLRPSSHSPSVVTASPELPSSNSPSVVTTPPEPPYSPPTAVCEPDPELVDAGFDNCCATCPTCGSERRLADLVTPLPVTCNLFEDDEPTTRELLCPGMWGHEEGFDHYFCGNGETVTLEETGLVDYVTQYWKNQKEQDIKNDICRWAREGTAPTLWSTDWDVDRPWPWECHFWIGGFKLYLTDFEREFGTCNFSIELQMQDWFDKPLDLYCGYPFPNNIWFSDIYMVTHTWTLDITCPEPCEPDCGGKGEACCGLDQCDGSLVCIDDVCMVYECDPNECKCEHNPEAILECGANLQWYVSEMCDDYVCTRNSQTGNCYCDPPNYDPSSPFP